MYEKKEQFYYFHFPSTGYENVIVVFVLWAVPNFNFNLKPKRIWWQTGSEFCIVFSRASNLLETLRIDSKLILNEDQML